MGCLRDRREAGSVRLRVMSDDPGTPRRAPAEEPRPDRTGSGAARRWERRDTATVVGIGMILAGILLAVIGRPKSALIWTGAIVAALGLLVDRIASFEAGTSGAKVTTRASKLSLTAPPKRRQLSRRRRSWQRRRRTNR